MKIISDDKIAENALCELFGKSDIAVTAVKSEKTSFYKKDGGFYIEYADIPSLCRAYSLLLSGKEERDTFNKFNTLCYMADVSRGAALTVSAAKRLIKYLARMGYNAFMLYTEDMLTLEEYPYFGYMRGRYSDGEIKEITDYADIFGIEVIPCIETLAHLEQALKFREFSDMRDSGGILLVGEEKTYEFLDALIGKCARLFKSKRINLGMDEAWGLGLGNYLRKNGYHGTQEIFLGHLSRVLALTKKHGYTEPMIWSDMPFAESFDGKYKVKTGRLNESIIKLIPKDVTLIYWDYLTDDTGLFKNMLENHALFENKKAFASGAWKWGGFAPHNAFSGISVKPQTEMTYEYGIRDFIVTGWGDSGGEASQFSVLPTLALTSCYAYGNPDDANALCLGAFGISYDDFIKLDLPNTLPTATLDYCNPFNPCKYLLYNDIMYGMLNMHMDVSTVADAYLKNADALEALAGKAGEFSYMFSSMEALCRLLTVKSTLSVKIREAYDKKDKESLREIAEKTVPKTVSLLDTFISLYIKQWYTENKPSGLEIHQIRLGGLRQRMLYSAERLLSYANGEVETLSELDEKLLMFDWASKHRETKYIRDNGFSSIISPTGI